MNTCFNRAPTDGRASACRATAERYSPLTNRPCLSRRNFLLSAAGGTVAASLASDAAGASVAPREFRRGGMLYRSLGKTGIDVSLLAFGSHTDHAYKRKSPIGFVLTEEGQARRDRQIAKAFDLGRSEE